MDITQFIVSQRSDALSIGDHNAYRARLTRQLLTLRKKLGRTTAKGKKYTGREPVTSEDIQKNHEFAHLLLLASERAWAHAMHVKSASSAGATSGTITGSARTHIISRLTKAYNTAQELVRLLDDQTVSSGGGGSDDDLLEARAYAASLDGARQFEKQHWKECLISFSEARIIYTALLSADKKEVFKDILTSVVDPSLRYAAYRSQIPRSQPVLAIARRFFPRSADDAELVSLIRKKDPDLLNEKPSAEQDNVPKTITWRTRTVEIEDAAISLALAAVDTASTKLPSLLNSDDGRLSAGEKAAAYDEVLIASQDAVDATKHAIEELIGEGVGQSDRRMQALQVTRTAVNYALIGWRIGRNRMLIGPEDGAGMEGGGSMRRRPRKRTTDGEEEAVVEKPEGTGRQLARLRERVVLYDAILQSIDSIKDLPGVAGDETFMAELQAKRNYFRALKCLSLSRSHTLLSSAQNALALLSLASNLSNQSLGPLQSTLSPSPASSQQPPTLAITPQQAQSLHSVLQTSLTRQHALVELGRLNHSTEERSSSPNQHDIAPLIERLDVYDADLDPTHLVTYPPTLEPVPVKPLFLDVAWNWIEYPGRGGGGGVGGREVLEQRLGGGKEKHEEQEKERETEQKGRRGWFGFGR
ncbi:MAG: hypothetical protein M1816_002857 [Peltula sp. TS41687]|nr:MAG: hypothetical protein M1816_002857 [Peltula sp. TS41687]